MKVYMDIQYQVWQYSVSIQETYTCSENVLWPTFSLSSSNIRAAKTNVSVWKKDVYVKDTKDAYNVLQAENGSLPRKRSKQ